ncbi:transmembrane protein, putative [Medicago truncatula]|uniref:Transmembrane protein, putative n=2 Tax=Medicago truncatula TaxID=3880 RepID=G7KJ51_MEDTR|nr:transmembrane protein, putative [Medicago truncatula]
MVLVMILVIAVSVVNLVLVPGQKGYGWMDFSNYSVLTRKDRFDLEEVMCDKEPTFMTSFCKSRDLCSLESDLMNCYCSDIM